MGGFIQKMMKVYNLGVYVWAWLDNLPNFVSLDVVAAALATLASILASALALALSTP